MEINEDKPITLNVSEGGGGSDVSKAYVDTHDNMVLDSAKKYTDDNVYDDTAIRQNITALDETKQDKLVAGSNITIEGNTISATGGSTGDVTKEYVDNQDNATLTSAKSYADTKVYDDTLVKSDIRANKDAISLKADKTELSTKVDKESGKGLFSGSYNDLTNKPTIPAPYDDSVILALVNANTVNLTKKADAKDVPTKVSQLQNDSGYLTEHQDISGKADKTTVYTKTEIDTMIGDVESALTSIIGG